MKKLILIIFLFSNLLVAQEPFMLQLTNEKGLPSMTVYQLLQDRNGYIWIGSANGLSRYDGRKFVNVDLSKLVDEEIITLKEDFLGRIWINNLSGQVGWINNMELQILDFEELPENSLPIRFDIQDSTLFINYQEKTKWLIVYQLLSNGSISKKASFSDLDSFEPKLTQTDNNGSFYFDRVNYRNNQLQFNYYQNDSLKKQYIKHHFDDIEIDEDDFLILGIDDRNCFLLANKTVFLRYDKENNKSEFIYDCSENRVNGCSIRGDKIWLFTKNGIIIFNSHSLIKEMTILNGNSTHSILEDREGNIWLPTTTNGIFLMYNMSTQVYNSKNSKIPKSDIYSISYNASDKSLLLGMSDGFLSKFDIEKENFINYKLPLSGRVVTIENDNKGILWLGLDDGVCMMNLVSGEIDITLLSSAVKVLKETSDQQMWYGASKRTGRWDNRQKSKPEQKLELILNKRTSSILEDNKSRIWIGTTDGLYKFTNDSITPFFGNERSKQYSITGIEQSSDSSLWVATANEGLLQIKNDKVVGHFSHQNGLTSNNCRSLYNYKNILLVGTDNGLNIININSAEISRVNMRDGLSSGEINSVATDGSQIWMGTPKGLVTLKFEDLLKKGTAPTIQFERLTVNGEDQNLKTNSIFEYWQNTLDFEYVGIDIKSNQKESYLYRLNGLNSDWLSTTSRIARFHTLQPGDYNFQVKTVNDIGVESLNSVDFQFTIKRPWWNSAWFYMGSAFFTFIILGSILFWRTKERRKRREIESELKERIQHLKSEALKSQMNPHFIYNSLNAIQDFFVTHDDESALIYLSKFAYMIRLIFDYSSRDTISFQEEIEFVSLYLDLEKLRFGDRVEVVFEIEEKLKNKAFEHEIPPILLQPIIENAFKHGLMHKLEGGKVLIRFAMSGDQIMCVVEDNGIGRKASSQMKSWRQKKRYGSLQAIEERLSIWDKNSNNRSLEIIDLKNSNGDSLGTRIITII